ncbi:hypothetical protein F5985_09935 [Malikia spinosa]|uniref:Uncharacterized protein n=1 Tax=Malikia spinosa TaxID=86180 RepID=A0A7C9NWQ2_9BURK|nr:hypothetical protein [Malikia spinosa]
MIVEFLGASPFRAGLSCCASSRLRRLAPDGLQSLTPARLGRRCALRLPPGKGACALPRRAALGTPWESRPGQALTGWRYRRFGRFHAERLVLRLQVLAAVLQQFTQFGTTATVALVFIHLGSGGPVRHDDFARPWLTFRGGGRCRMMRKSDSCWPIPD